MKNTLEQPFVINGVKSWIECIDLSKQKPSQKIPSLYHYHDYIELLYATDANAYVWFNGKKQSFHTGDLVIVNSKVPHTLTFNEVSSYICIKFLPQILYADENSLSEFKYALPFLLENSHQKVFDKHALSGVDVGSLIIEIMTEWKNKKPAYELVIRANILKLFAGIFREWSEHNVLGNYSQIPDTIKSALAYVEENLDSVTEKDVADHCNVSYNHFSFIFKNAMGKSFNEYITFLRLREAETLLLSSNMSITEIAASSGFSTTSYFIAKFKKSKGITPRQFREKTFGAKY